MTIQEFNNQFAELVNQALLNGIASSDVLLTLDAAAFDIRFSMAVQRQRQNAIAMAAKIVPASQMPNNRTR